MDITETVNLLSPIVLLKEVDNLIKNKGEKYFFISEWYKHKDHKQIFWNIVYYFTVLRLPTFVLTYLKEDYLIDEILEDLEKYRNLINSNKKNTSSFVGLSNSNNILVRNSTKSS